tara:strand:+ start:7420 stop:8247 length:828 start_codon:yes stop_codon:yes gene_type:complete
MVSLTVISVLGCTQEQSSEPSIAAPVISSDPPDLSGIWQTMNTASWNLEGHTASKMPVTNILGALGGIPAGMSVVEGGEIPYLPEALEKRDQNRSDWTNLDPVAKCYIPGVPRSTYMPWPFQILQTDTEIFVAYEFGSNSRTIFMDRPGTEAPLPSWMGYSLGHWEGETLVVNVTKQVPDTWLDASGNYHGPNLVVEERYTLIDENHMQYEATIDDPDVFSRPWKIKIPLYRRMEDEARLLEYKCVEFGEDLLYDHLRKGYDGPKALDGSLLENI